MPTAAPDPTPQATTGRVPAAGSKQGPPSSRPSSDEGQRTLAEVGEAGVLAAIFPVLEADPATAARYVRLGPGDDCAVLAAPDGQVVVSSDVLVEGQDFLLDTSSGRDIGAKAAAANLADIAAMGAVTTSMVVALVAPARTTLGFVVDLAAGLGEAARAAGAVVVGGDLSDGPVVMVSVTVLGDLQGRAPVRRDGARPGDVLAFAGSLGWAAAGLEVLSREGDVATGAGSSLPSEAGVRHALARARAHQRSARVPLAAGPRAARAAATAMIDVSDGLLRDADRIAQASGVVVVVDSTAGPVEQARQGVAPVAQWLGHAEPMERAWTWVLAGGEDHGLLATFPDAGQVPDGFEVIGRVESAGAGSSGLRVDGPGARVQASGWDHYRR
ncbi:MAG: thiamine-phosphate kinase [Actinomycetales bacterium]